jgi:hypothetical protein
MTGPLLALALAAAPEIFLPPWPLSPDGELVAFRGEGALSADGATVEPAGAGLFRVVPARGAERVTLRAGGAEAVAPVEPPAGMVVVAVRPAAPVKGRDAAVEIEVEVRRSTGEPDAEATPPEVAVSSGRIRDLAASGPGRFRAIYEPAATRYPEVAVLLALVPRCPLCPTPRAVGYAIVPLAAAVALPGQSEPGARTTVTVAGRAFGPAVADASGRFSVRVVIPPGARFASASSVDALGNTRIKEIDLRLPEVDRLACAAWPRAIPADGRSEAGVWCVASTPGGAPAEEARLALAASSGEAGPLAPERGALQRARYRAPSGGGGKDAVLRATYPDGVAASRDEIRIALAAGAPAAISATVAREPVPLGATVPAETSVRDARGDLLGPATGPPGASEGFVAPDRFVAAAAGRSQRAPISFALAPGHEVASLTLRRDGPDWLAVARTVDGRPAADVPLRFGGGAVATTDARGEARASATAARETVVAPGGARAAGWAGVSPPAAPFEISTAVEIALRPPSRVDVIASVEAGALRWRIEDAGGRPIPGRRVTLRADGIELGPAERDGEGGRAPIRGGRGVVAVVDDETGIAAVVEVR